MLFVKHSLIFLIILENKLKQSFLNLTINDNMYHLMFDLTKGYFLNITK